MSLLYLRKFDPGDVVLDSSCPETPPIEIPEATGKDSVAQQEGKKPWIIKRRTRVEIDEPHN
jgi:hypothetical protein